MQAVGQVWAKSGGWNRMDSGASAVPAGFRAGGRWLILRHSSLERRSAADGRRQSPLVEIVELAADRHAMGEARDLHLSVVQEIGDVVRGALAVDRGVEREDDLLHRPQRRCERRHDELALLDQK